MTETTWDVGSCHRITLKPSGGYTITVDGCEVIGVVAFDIKAGWVRKYKTDENGDAVLIHGFAHDYPAQETVRGQVGVIGPKPEPCDD